ncbi:hypothetical protein C7999DRAFT_40088 [Corynascus novoguineensis]|uniref:Uncharacterized protein n=1 Tax=Corynascus novoguineensis TaxID=1126955 RepID=A0AAN7CXG7_9PEZI|nr:hypothetical protein C7999DRAFT_40088 [Corynascus novoguineensis]
MEGRTHLFRLPLPAPRRPAHQRTASSSSEASDASSSASHISHDSEDQFVLSPTHTPAQESAPPRARLSRFSTDPSAAGNDLLWGKEVSTRPRNSENIAKSPSHPKIALRSITRPLGTELPRIASGSQRADTSSAASGSLSTPAEPLSARGDVPGGYFPLHEDPESRVHIPHPFSFDADMARQNSQRKAAESSKGGAESRIISPTHGPEPAHASLSNLTSPDTPISSYLPSGHHDDVVLPMGKYYPSNWERRHGKTPQKSRPPVTSQPAAPAVRSEPQVPKFQQGDQAHQHRPGSDVKRRLQQYQRDMVAQAAMAANALLASSGSAGSIGAPSLSGLPLPVPRGQLAATFLKTHKPLSPRLQPVGSPGPVTPMSLESDSYLSLGSPGAGVVNAPEMAGKGKQRRKDSCSSPTIELGVASI